MTTIRTFFAIIPPKEMHVYLLDVLKILKKIIPVNIRWVDPQNVHITLQFLGQLQTEDLGPLSEKVRGQLEHVSSFLLALGPLEVFPSLHHPKILSLVAEPHDILLSLATTIAQAVKVFNYPIDSRPFRGHMTIGRVVHLHHFNREKVQLLNVKLTKIPLLPIDKIFLIESKFKEGKMEYSPLAQFPLT